MEPTRGTRAGWPPTVPRNYNTTSSEGLVVLLAGDAACERLPTYLRVAFDSILEEALLTWTRQEKMHGFLAF
jgi:hypothetical protein